MATQADVFDELAKALSPYCDAPEVVIRIEMEFARDPYAVSTVSVVRHFHDPNNIFDRSRDTELALAENEWVLVRSNVQEYLEISKGWKDRLIRTTLSIYQDGGWSVGSTSGRW
jgi:hypothetical protein